MTPLEISTHLLKAQYKFALSTDPIGAVLINMQLAELYLKRELETMKKTEAETYARSRV